MALFFIKYNVHTNVNISWAKYINTKRESGQPQPLLVKALEYVSKRDFALDIGAGPLIDAEFLFNQGFGHVVAIDPEPETKKIATNLSNKNIEYLSYGIEKYKFPSSKFDLINAQFIFPYLPEKTLNLIWRSIYNSLAPGGILTGQFYGERDSWNVCGDYRIYTSEDKIKELLADYEIIFLNEVEKDTTSRLGKLKHTHFFEFIVRKN